MALLIGVPLFSGLRERQQILLVLLLLLATKHRNFASIPLKTTRALHVSNFDISDIA